MDLSRLVTDRCRSGEALEHIMSAIALWVGADGCQKSRCQDLLCAWQTAKQIVIGVVLEERCNPFTILVQLLVQQTQEFAQAQGKLAFGLGDRLAGLELISLSKDVQALLGGLRPPQPVGMEELLPAAPAGFDQGLGGRKLNDKIPREGTGPIVKGLECRRIIFQQGLLKFVDQESALLN